MPVDGCDALFTNSVSHAVGQPTSDGWVALRPIDGSRGAVEKFQDVVRLVRSCEDRGEVEVWEDRTHFVSTFGRDVIDRIFVRLVV